MQQLLLPTKHSEFTAAKPQKGERQTTHPVDETHFRDFFSELSPELHLLFAQEPHLASDFDKD